MLKRLKTAWQFVRRGIEPAAAFAAHRDTMAFAALAVMAYGFWCAWPPLGFIVPGAVVLCLAVVGKLRAD